VIRGDQHVDFKISHKVVLTTKISVDGSWGSWKNTNATGEDESFYKKGINGLTRNIALLIGCPPTRVKILGNGTATKSAFWNQDTTSEEFAPWIWEQNKSMDRMKMDEWLTAPGASLPHLNNTNSSNNTPSLFEYVAMHKNGHNPRTDAFLLQFSENRRGHVASALALHGVAGERWHHNLDLLTLEERHAVLERRSLEALQVRGDDELGKLQSVVATIESRKTMGAEMEKALAAEGKAVVELDVDEEPQTVPALVNCKPGNNLDCETLDEHSKNLGELAIESEGLNVLNKCQVSSDSECKLPNALEGCTDCPQPEILNAIVDKVPMKANPLGWLCSKDSFMDGVCDCDCGIWDPDCEPGSNNRVAAIQETVETNREKAGLLSLLDRDQVEGVMNWLDAEGNGNGVLDGKELLKIDSLGASALFGVAKRIIEAQEAGDNVGTTAGSMRRGNFALLQAKQSHSCNNLLTAHPFPATTATYTPMCVKDEVFQTRVGKATGRCSLLPKMTIGSQCVVPGDGKIKPSSKPDGSMLTSKSVCGRVAQIFPKGAGRGGILSAGVGKSSAEWYHRDLAFVPGSSAPGVIKQNFDMLKAGLQALDASFEYGVSFYAKIKFNSFPPRANVFEFKGDTQSIVVAIDSHGWHQEHERTIDLLLKASGTIRDSPHRHRRRRGQYTDVRAKRAARNGQEDEFLFSFHPKGRLQIWRNGVSLAKMVPGTGDKAFDISGNKKKATSIILGTGPNRHNYAMDSEMRDIRIWSKEVSWDEAVAGTVPGDEPTPGKKDEKGELDGTCIASQKNSWDFMCGEELPEDLAESYGYQGKNNGQAAIDFEKRLTRGELVACGQKMHIKGVIYSGKFGDGLTAEYFRKRAHCNQMPSLFGQLPKLVRVDPQINFDGDFVAPHDQFVIRWSGKLLIKEAGTYEFSLGADDGAWLALDGIVRLDNGRCKGRGHEHAKKYEFKALPIELEKGSHDLEVLYYSAGKSKGKCQLKYSGKDTEGKAVLIPQEKLGSAPLRLAQLAKALNANKTKTVKPREVIKGAFYYDEEAHVGIMPVGACDIDCQRGKRKSGGAYFKFHCSKSSTVSMKAVVNSKAERAFVWLDEEQGKVWELAQTSASLFEGNATSEDYSMMGSPDDIPGPMKTSAISPTWQVSAGEHTLVFQGRPDKIDFFALKKLTFEAGADACQFFLDGSDKSPGDCY
jgi:hypothetical protein